MPRAARIGAGRAARGGGRDFALVVDEPDLRVKLWPGRSRRLVVAFTGVGMGHGGVQTDEFVGSSSAGNANVVACVIDRGRSWFSNVSLRDRIVAAVDRVRADHGISDVVTLGNSMGGYGALLLARRLGARVAAAFVPQASIAPEVVAETRWPQFREAVDLAAHLPLPAALAPTTSHYAIYGADSAPDMRHAALLEATGLVRVHRVAGTDHGVALAIKQAGLLPDLIAALLDDRADDVAACLHRFEAAHRPGGTPIAPPRLQGDLP